MTSPMSDDELQAIREWHYVARHIGAAFGAYTNRVTEMVGSLLAEVDRLRDADAASYHASLVMAAMQEEIDRLRGLLDGMTDDQGGSAMTDPLPITQSCGCPVGEGHRCPPPFNHQEDQS